MSENNANKWMMPAPVFRSSTGELVHPGVEHAVDPEPDTLEPAYRGPGDELDPEPDTIVPDNPLANLYAPPDGHATRKEKPAPGAPAIDIEPQPFISEELTAERIVVEPTAAAAKTSSRSAFFVIGLLLLLGLAVGFIWVVYYLFFSARTNTSGF